MPSYSDKSRERLSTCHPDLQALFFEVIKHRDCTILCGHRAEAEQNQAYAEGKSKAKWPQSNHNTIPSNAVDAAPWPLVWHDKQSFIEFGNFVEGVAAGLGIKIRWGGRFQSFFDGVHFELVSERHE